MIKNFKDYLIEETREVYFTFGRMNPPTIGHGKVMDTLSNKASGSDWKVYLSHTTGPKDPLSYSDKIKHLRKMFPKYGRNIIVDKGVKNVFDIARVLYDAGYKRINMVVGEDRLREFDVLLNKYNGKKARHGFYNFESIKVVSAGQRDPDAEGVTGISGTKMRNHASNNDYKSFKAGLHANHNDEQAKKLFKATRQGMNLQKEERGMKDFATFLTEDMEGMSQKSGDKRSTESGAGMTAKGVAKYNRRTGGNLKTAVTTPPSKLKKGSKAAGRRKSFCARSKGWTGERGKAARRRWNC